MLLLMLCPVFWLFAVEEQVYSPSLLTASWSRHLWSLLLLHLIPCLPYITTNFPRFSKQFLCLYFPASVISFSSNTSQFSGHFPFRNLQFHQKDIFFCLSVRHTSHTCYISLQALWAGLVFPLKQISNSNDSCYHLEISYVPGTVLNTWSIVTHLFPWNPDLSATLTQARAQGATVNCLRAQLSGGGGGEQSAKPGWVRSTSSLHLSWIPGWQQLRLIHVCTPHAQRTSNICGMN